MRQLHSEVEIEAPPARVWHVFTDFRSFPSWNPFIRKAIGRLERGGRLDVELLLGRRLIIFHPRLTVVDEPRELRWVARQFIPGLFDVDRRFLLEPVEESACRFVQSERATGLLAPVVMPFVRRQILNGYRELNTALKKRVEQNG